MNTSRDLITESFCAISRHACIILVPPPPLPQFLFSQSFFKKEILLDIKAFPVEDAELFVSRSLSPVSPASPSLYTATT